MKENTLGMKLLMAVVTLGVLTYFGIQGWRYLSDPLTTTLAYTYEVEESMDLSGYVVRQEQVITDSSGSGLMQIQRGEGERVSAGGTVAAVYADQASLDRQNEMEQLRIQIEQLQYAQEASLGSEASLKLDAQIMQSILDYRSSISADKLYDAEKEGAQLRALVLKRDYTYADTGDLDAQIAQLQSQLQTLRSQAAGSVRRITAPQSGLYSAVVDGYESVLTPQSLAEMTPSQLNTLQPAQTDSTQVGKLVLGESWYYAAVMSADAAQELQEQAQELKSSGRQLYLRFTKGVDQDLPVTIASVGPEENGRVVVTFEGTEYLAQLTLLRAQSAQVIFTAYSGIRIPTEALRSGYVTQDSEGNLVSQEGLGVYCVVGMKARFKPVELVHRGEEFVLVTSGEISSESQRLRPGDTVIVAAENLYDGKVLN